MLRFLANVVEDLYQREVPLDLILPGDLNLERPAIRQEFLKHIGPQYEGVIGSDIAGHEAKSKLLDKANKQWKHLAQCISTSIFFHSFSADDSTKGINLPYIKLAVLRSDTIPALVTDVLTKLSNTLWYLNSRGDVYYFSRIPNLNRMILDKKELFSDSYEHELRNIIQKELGNKFRAYLWPENNEGIPDNRELKLVILLPEDAGDQIPTWIERRGNSFREYKNTLFFSLADTAGFGKLREDVKTYLALQDIQSEIDTGDSPLLEGKREEVKNRIKAITRDYSYNVRRMYHMVQFGTRSVDLGQPVTGKESLDGWFWRELTSSDLGAILTQLHYRTIVNKFMTDNEQISTAVILDQFYKNPELPTLSAQGVLARAIQLGVQEGAFSLVAVQEGEIVQESLKFKEIIPLDAIIFDTDTFILSGVRSEAILAALEPEFPEPESKPFPEPTPGPGPEPQPEPGPGPQPEKVYRRVRLVITGVQASKIADVNRGILVPLNRAVGDFNFTIEIDVSSEEGIL